MKNLLALIFISITMVSMAGAQAASDKPPQLQPPGTPHARKVDVARIQKQVRHELVMLPRLNVFDNIAFQVKDDATVVLLGQVRTASLKSEAEQAAKSVEGVEVVENKIEVLPASPGDDRIRLAVARAIFRHPALFRYSIQSVPPIHIIVNRGHVTLEGVVDSEGDKNIAGIKANSVSGVFSVTNNLRVEK